MTAARNLYDILNVSHDAQPVVIEAAYRALMKKYHPDQGSPAEPGAPSAAAINHAYSILRDAERRTQYDHLEWTRQQNVHLAQYQPPPPPRTPRVFGWGGWVVALLLAGVILLMARDREDLATVDSPATALAAPLGEIPEQGARTEPAFLRSGAPEREVDMLRSLNTRSSNPMPAEARGANSASPRAYNQKRQKQRSARPRRRGAKAAHSKDFLERQDYIY
jgi:curved DNA-binding protein CbpA